ncbi:hypothetical protein AAC387_Pa08g1232 [Persea americana]
MTRATEIKDRLRTITGPLQLLRIWVYSRTAVGCPIRRELAVVRVDFPLFKMWQTALSTQPCSTTIQEVRTLLDTADGDQDVLNFCTFAMATRFHLLFSSLSGNHTSNGICSSMNLWSIGTGSYSAIQSYWSTIG